MNLNEDQARTVGVNANVLLDTGQHSVTLVRCEECGTPGMTGSPDDLLVCGYCGNDEHIAGTLIPADR